MVGFDLDMTLIDTVVGFAVTLDALGAELGVEFPTEEVLGVHVVGRGSAPFPDDVVARIRAARVDPPEAAAGRIRPLP